MKKPVVASDLLAVTLLVLYGLAGCVMPEQSGEQPPEEALTYEQLLANLDALEAPAARSLARTGRTVFPMPNGSNLSSSDLSAYLGGIKTDLAGYIYKCTESRPYMVIPVRLTWKSEDGIESGLMWLPFTWGIPRSFPVISYQHGTQVYEGSAPSSFHPNPLVALSSPDLAGALQNYVECIVGALMAAAGYIVVMPDYVGFGINTGPDHPYVTKALGESVKGILDAARLALNGKAVRPNGKVFLTGYSEGGYAAMAGARTLQDAGDPLTAVVPCAGAYDLSGTMLEQMLTQEVKVPSYLLYALSGYHAVYPSDIVYSNLLISPPYYEYVTVDRVFDGSRTNAYINALGLPSKPADMLTADAVSNLLAAPDGTVYKLLEANNAWKGWKPGTPVTPVVFVHCPQDDVVPYANAEVAQAALVALGVLAPIIDVPPIPFIDQLAGSVHMAAYPTAMVAAFMIIDTIE